jgi:hypothetical protein
MGSVLFFLSLSPKVLPGGLGTSPPYARSTAIKL